MKVGNDRTHARMDTLCAHLFFLGDVRIKPLQCGHVGLEGPCSGVYGG